MSKECQKPLIHSKTIQDTQFTSMIQSIG